MKKLNSKLWRVLSKAVLACALVAPVFVSSCSKIDDDLMQEIANINDELSKINERISNLEEKLNKDVNTLTELINGKITVVSCVTNDKGVITVVLSDGNKITVYPEAEKIDLSGVTFLTTLEEDGALYWATCTVGGTPEFLLVDGKKVPVSVKPDLKIEDGKWFISVDGGKTWVETGIEEDNSEAVISFFSNVTEDDDYVYLTLVSGTVVKVAKDKEVAFSAPFGKQYFAFGETKALTLEMVGVKNYTVTEKPEGWKVKIASKKMSITAPAEDNASADASGVIKVLATFDNASPIIASVTVTTEEPDFTMALEGENVVFTLAEKNVDNFNYNGYVYGALPKSEFSPAAAIEYLKENFPYSGTQSYDSFTYSISQLVGESYDPSVSYIVFSTNYKDVYWGEEYNEEDIVCLVYTPVKINVEITPSLDNAYLKLSFAGCDAVYAGVAYAEYYTKEDILGQFGSRWYTPTPVTEAYEGPIGLIAGGYDQFLEIGKDFVFWLIVKNENDEYTEADVKEYPFSTLPLVLGGSLAAPEIVVNEVTTSSISASVSVVEGCYKTYAYAFEKNAPNFPTTEEDMVNYLVRNGMSEELGEISVRKTYQQPSTEFQICAVAIDELGKVGALATKDTKTLDLVFNENIAVEIESVTVGPTSATVKFAFTGDVSKIHYCYQNDNYGIDRMENNMALGTAYTTKVNVADLVDNTLEITGLSLGTTYNFFVMAFNEAGENSHMAQTTFTPESDIVFIKRSNENWAYGKPEISNEVWGEEDAWINLGGTWYPRSISLDVTITLPAECKKAFVWATDPDYLTSDTELTISDKVVVKGTPCEESGVLNFEYVNSSYLLYVVWIDNNDEYHTYDKYILTFPACPSEE